MVPPLIRQSLTTLPSGRLTTALAVSGEPVFPYCYFRQAAPGGIWVRRTAALHQPAVLCRTVRTYFFPSVRYFYEADSILTKCQVFVKHKRESIFSENTVRTFRNCIVPQFTRSISSALLRVVSVILVPPIIRASSCFRPSRSRGVTVV